MAAVRKILVPIDGSECSMRALEYAGKRQVASAHVQLLVLNVQSPMPPSRFVTKAMITDHYKLQAEQAFKPARALIERMKLEVDCYSRIGDPASTIASFASKTGCSEIVMGTRGLGKLAGLVLGSVASKVIHLSKVPVTLVK